MAREEIAPEAPPLEVDPRTVLADDFHLRAMIVGLTGVDGGGKTTLAKGLGVRDISEIHPILPDLGFRSISVIPFRAFLHWHGYDREDSADGLAAYHEELRENGEGEALLNRILNMPPGFYVIDAVHKKLDMDYLRDHGVMFLGMTASNAVAKRHYASDTNDEKHLSVRTARIEELEKEGNPITGMSRDEGAAILHAAVEEDWEKRLSHERLEEIADSMENADYILNVEKPVEIEEKGKKKTIWVVKDRLEIRQEAVEVLGDRFVPAWTLGQVLDRILPPKVVPSTD